MEIFEKNLKKRLFAKYQRYLFLHICKHMTAATIKLIKNIIYYLLAKIIYIKFNIMHVFKRQNVLHLQITIYDSLTSNSDKYTQIIRNEQFILVSTPPKLSHGYCPHVFKSSIVFNFVTLITISFTNTIEQGYARTYLIIKSLIPLPKK